MLAVAVSRANDRSLCHNDGTLQQGICLLSKQRVLAALRREEPECVPTGENAVNYELVEGILAHPTLYDSNWREPQALWGRGHHGVWQANMLHLS